VSWLSALEAAQVDYRNLPLPHCRHRIANSIETRFDFVDAQEAQVDRMLEIIAKVEASIDDLREHERLRGPATPARR
jgi:hypothetical protein